VQTEYKCRMGHIYCSKECADLAWPNFNQRSFPLGYADNLPHRIK